jgi:NAD(P)-dependent dehydrogenase (short-subunit alcohol dehydrogenase family)
VDLGLKGKTAIVTGGARGLGEAMVAGFAREGASVIIADILYEKARDLAAKLSSGKTKVIAIKTDVRKRADADNLAKTALAEFGKIDILVNDAGVITDSEFLDIEEEEWDRVMDTNAKGVYLVTQAVLPHMIAARYGKIVNISSRAGKSGAPTNAHYSASKFAVIGLTQSLAMALAKHSINVNAICPGIIRTQMWEELLDARTKRLGVEREELFNRTIKAVVPMCRPVEPADIANMVLFLSSDVARNVTGETINVNAGSLMD